MLQHQRLVLCASKSRHSAAGGRSYKVKWDVWMVKGISVTMALSVAPRIQPDQLDESDQASQPDDTPYAQLIYQALMSVDGHQMILKEASDEVNRVPKVRSITVE